MHRCIDDDPRQNNVSFLWLAGERRICASFTFIMWKRLFHSGDPLRSEKERKILSRPFFFLRTIEDLRPRLTHGNVIRADVSVLDSSISPGSQRNENFRKNRSNTAKISFPLSFPLDSVAFCRGKIIYYSTMSLRFFRYFLQICIVIEIKKQYYILQKNILNIFRTSDIVRYNN